MSAYSYFCALLFVFTMMANATAGATYIPSSSSSSGTNSPAASGASANSSAGFRMAIGVTAATGSTSNQSGSVASRGVNTLGLSSQLGFKSKYLEPFVYGEYDYAQQATPAAQVSNTNVSGSGYLAGAGIAIDIGSARLSGAYIALGRYSLQQSTSTGQTAAYSDPTGYRFAIDYEISSGLLISAIYRVAEYKTFEQGGAASDISTNKLSQSQTGLGIAWGF